MLFACDYSSYKDVPTVEGPSILATLLDLLASGAQHLSSTIIICIVAFMCYHVTLLIMERTSSVMLSRKQASGLIKPMQPRTEKPSLEILSFKGSWASLPISNEKKTPMHSPTVYSPVATLRESPSLPFAVTSVLRANTLKSFELVSPVARKHSKQKYSSAYELLMYFSDDFSEELPSFVGDAPSL